MARVNNAKKLIVAISICMAGLFDITAWSEPIHQSTERIIWDKTPLTITLPVKTERIISFPTPVKVGLPPDLSAQLRTQINGNTVYWLAHEAFDTRRIEVHAMDGSMIYLVDLQAQRHASIAPIEVILKQKNDSQPPSTAVTGSAQPSYRPLGMMGLTRFAAQQLYAPARLLKTPPGVYRFPVMQRPIEHLIRGQNILATPVAAWKNERYYLTALILKNLSDTHVQLDPRMIRGQWRAATFHYVRLHPTGSELDTSVLYLVSDRPFSEVL